MAKHYVLALLHKENDVFGISFPDYPGVISGGDTFDQAVNKGASALSFHLYGMAEDGDEISLPPPQEQAVRNATSEIDNGALPAFIEIEFPGKSVRINVSVEEGLLSQIDKAAARIGQSRSAFLADAARSRLRSAA
ncbi:type II toxin-antitoxin system HicB family antitoxin [Rhizobium binae]|uniref:type II toxin-antitoxin system HicB family antitoxin n=1 Tax=Rhizobium binae TaxID=1138190 RepID=UPI001C840585|nr:type II toxin-antitoxin system HicB family antitoxin [Rhizobium binae]MBX4941155.1 ribbon-helix-helix protein, CopG family [Rhizobium binae]